MIDAHCHLDSLPAHELAGTIARAVAAGVTGMVTVGRGPASSETSIALAEAFPEVRAAVGVHPWQVAHQSVRQVTDAVSELATRHRVVAIGEIGLDYDGNLITGESYHAEAVRALQREYFAHQLHLAHALNLPAIIHSRGGAHADVAAIVRSINPSTGKVIQFLNGTDDDVSAYMELRFYFSVGGPATDPGDVELRRAIEAIPLDRLLLETDTPYAPAIWKRDGRSEPADLPAIAADIARLKGVALTELVEITTVSAHRLFRFS